MIYIQEQLALTSKSETPSVICVCRRGNDSQVAVQKLQAILQDAGVSVKDIIGGLHSWARHIDKDFPVY